MSHRSLIVSLVMFFIVLGSVSLGLPSVANAVVCDAPDAAVRSTGDACTLYYVVQADDTLSGIARRCGVPTAQLAQANGLRLEATIYPGQRLVMPAAVLAAQVSAASSGVGAGCPAYYTVQAGDTLAKIARRCNVSVASLKRWNGLRSDVIRRGQVLITRAVFAPAPSDFTHRPPASPAVATPTYPVCEVPAARDPTELVATPAPTPAIESQVSPW